MPTIEVKDGTLRTTRFGDDVRVPIPEGGRVEIRPSSGHADVEVRDKKGASVRSFRLPKEDGS